MNSDYFFKNSNNNLNCNRINEYAKKQNTIYDPSTNQILYGINKNMNVIGNITRVYYSSNQVLLPIEIVLIFLTNVTSSTTSRRVRRRVSKNTFCFI